jgi:hypothetical protein
MNSVITNEDKERVVKISGAARITNEFADRIIPIKKLLSSSKLNPAGTEVLAGSGLILPTAGEEKTINPGARPEKRLPLHNDGYAL